MWSRNIAQAPMPVVLPPPGAAERAEEVGKSSGDPYGQIFFGFLPIENVFGSADTN
jgi:hypothetical protein